MSRDISKLADVHSDAVLGENVTIGPFCVVGKNVELGDNCVLDSNVVLTGHTKIGPGNRFWPGSVIGTEPQDVSFKDAPTKVEIGSNNMFREGVTVHRGAEKEDHVTRLGDNNLLMANSHVAHNCAVGNNCILVNGSLLGGHVHLHDGVIVSGNSAVHHFGTIGTLAFISGMTRCTVDVPPYVLAAGADKMDFRTVNVVGMKRRGISSETIHLVRNAVKMLFRQRVKADAVREQMVDQCDGILPIELLALFDFVEKHSGGRGGRGRDGAAPSTKPKADSTTDTKAA